MSESSDRTLEFDVHMKKGRNGRKQILAGAQPDGSNEPVGRIPRITRLMALAIKMDGMLQRGEVKNYAELAVLGHVTRARITQIMNLLQLAPDIQEAILNLELVRKGPDPIKSRPVLKIATELDWRAQRRTWQKAFEDASGESTP